MNWLKKILLGKPLENEALKDEKYSVFWGLPILASDSISSVAYATEEILLVLIPVIGLLAYHQLSLISAAIIGLLIILTISYRQTIINYPNGGGAYVVASENLGAYSGILAGSSLAVGYILTVAVSIAAGTAAITSAFPELFQYRVEISLIILVLLFIGNMRGIRESAQIFGLPTYAFILGIVAMSIIGLMKTAGSPHPLAAQPEPIGSGALESITLLLILRAFSSGCAALTGVEAVSNAVPNFKSPAQAQRVLVLLSLFVLICFGGISLLANIYQVVPVEGKTVLSQIAEGVFGRNHLMYYYIQATTALILAMAANTAFAGFPMLISVMSRDGFAPRQLSHRGERLNYSNGIIALTVIAGLLLIIFKSDTHRLIPLYAIGVFISFTLSQAGMFRKWIKSREKGWTYKAVVNGMGALVTLITVLIVGYTKFTHGAWIVAVIVPVMMAGFIAIKKHYMAVAAQLRLSQEEFESLDLNKSIYRNHVIVPIESINKASVRALRYARTISDNVVAFNVAINEENERKIKEKWQLLNTDIPLFIKYSCYRKVMEPLMEFIHSYEEHSYKKGDMITVILPQFSVRTWWHYFLHNQTRIFIQRELLQHKHIVVATMPLQLKRDREVLPRHLNLNKIHKL
jgi:amino acid transporter